MATMRDVAERAGVSIATVSFVVNGTKRVTDVTRERVEAAMRELGFRRNPVGAALANGRTRIIALLFPTLERTLSHTAVAFFTSAARRARALGYDLILWPIGSDIEHIDVLARGGLVDGVILMEVKLADPRVSALVTNDVPFAMIGRTADPSGVPYVDIDMAASAREAYERLVDVGHSNIAYIYSEGVKYDHGADARARQTYRETAEAHGSPPTLIPCSEHPTAGRELGERFAAEYPDVTAVILLNEHAAPGFMTGLAHAGVRVPQDLSVLSLGSSAYMAAMTDPPLSYLRTPGPELGELGFDAVLQRLTAPTDPPMQALLPCEYVEGGTLAVPRG
ncbi:MAG TPA: LacI family DNA-binding transcriptional regulator, partial [Microbacterium sp.]|nr:LacI family DNA-binding transcriptional regulator [Microbacterium sp.]